MGDILDLYNMIIDLNKRLTILETELYEEDIEDDLPKKKVKREEKEE